jgi:hypothetical protein
MRKLIEETRTADTRCAQGEWWRSQRRGLRQVGLPVLAIWGAETIMVVAIVVMLVTR